MVSIGKSSIFLLGIASLKNTATGKRDMPEIRVELVIQTRPNARQHLRQLEKKAEELNGRIGVRLEFDPQKASTEEKCRIYIRKEIDLRARENWPAATRWLTKYLRRFADVFGPIVRGQTEGISL